MHLQAWPRLLVDGLGRPCSMHGCVLPEAGTAFSQQDEPVAAPFATSQKPRVVLQAPFLSYFAPSLLHDWDAEETSVYVSPCVQRSIA